jgi:DNA-binding transcriptional regulator YbjK
MPTRPGPPTVPASPARRARRHEPDRKDRIIDVTLEVVAEHGVAGTTHRLVATAADVPLGSMTYYFTGLNDLLEQAFRRHATRMAALYEHHFDQVRTRAQLVEAVTDLVHGNNASTPRDSVVTFELYLAALRDPSLRSITESWMATSRAVLRRYVDPVTARGVDALIEGLIMHAILSTQPVSRAQTMSYVDRALGAAAVQDPRTGAP